MQLHAALGNSEFVVKSASFSRNEVTEHFEDILRVLGECKVAQPGQYVT